ncbi:hypothetical protein [Rhodococcus jostii]|uniref:hypothetical protein n=1 Tax=Rhodococcus jostii TaxID=132919 RepID=UPI003C6DC5EF
MGTTLMCSRTRMAEGWDRFGLTPRTSTSTSDHSGRCCPTNNRDHSISVPPRWQLRPDADP